MVTIKLKDTDTTILCGSAEDAYHIYSNLGNRYTFIINGDELETIGEKKPGTYFAGYSKSYFEKHYFSE